MDLKSLILAEHSKAHTMAVAQFIGNDHEKFGELWELVKNGEPPVHRRAAWVMDACVEANPVLFEPYLVDAIDFLPRPNHNAIHRNLTKVLARMNIPEDLQGQLYDICLNWLISPQIHVAIKAHSMVIAYNIAKGIPELEEELAFVLKDQMEFNSAGFKSRGMKILKKMNKG